MFHGYCLASRSRSPNRPFLVATSKPLPRAQKQQETIVKHSSNLLEGTPLPWPVGLSWHHLNSLTPPIGRGQSLQNVATDGSPRCAAVPAAFPVSTSNSRDSLLCRCRVYLPLPLHRDWASRNTQEGVRYHKMPVQLSISTYYRQFGGRFVTYTLPKQASPKQLSPRS